MKNTLLLLFAMLLSSLVSSGQVSCNEKSIGGWQQLNIDYTAANATEYIQVNIANASARTTALFDNLTITETPPVIVQENHYDPWGVNLVGIEKELLPVNRFKFLGRETQAETGWVDLMQRMYEPPLGRFTSVDPVTASQESLSTYQYGWNNPVLRSDRNGDCPECPESGFLIARLMTTAFYDTKHAIANTAFRAVRSDLRADYKVENGKQVFETSYTRQPQDNSVSGVAKEVVNTIADVAVVVGVKGGGGNIGLLSKTSETQGVRAAKDVGGVASQVKISEVKSGLKQVYEKLGIDSPLPKGEKGKFGSPTAGDSKKGYRLDPAHPDRPKGDKESVPHINFWDWTGGKKDKGGKYGAIPLKKPDQK